MKKSLIRTGWICMAIPAICQMALFLGDLQLTRDAAAVGELENHQLEASAIVLNIVALSEQDWSVIFDRGMSGKSSSIEDRYQLNKKRIQEQLSALERVPLEKKASQNLVANVRGVIEVLNKATNEQVIESVSPPVDGNPMNAVIQRLIVLRGAVVKYSKNFEFMLGSLNERRDELHRLRIEKEKQIHLIENFLFFALFVDAIAALTLPLFFLKGLTHRLRLLVDNARRLPTNEPLLSNVGGEDEIAFLNGAMCEASDRLKQSEQGRQLLMDMLAHDIRSPLTSAGLILGELNLPETSSTSETSQKLSRLQIIFRQVKRLVEDLLYVERFEQGSFALDLQFLDLKTLAKNALLSAEPQAQQKQLSMRLQAPADPVEVAADAERVTQILDNLLSNAIKYSPVEGEVCLDIRRASEVVSISVLDDGPGIPPELEEKIFERQYQTKDGSQRGGFGLGLAICKQLVLKHGGKIYFRNRQPKGSSITFTLPVEAEPDEV